ncbi:NAD(P)/FAD-dependent oxidoreductase [Antarcticibacterium sp. 1MA-6-2]|uniref:NAD(P)/FAD-dependent oxidoreductase n=1 Tax=Antarcticibacterium sp. 1MA-6-2 TaxID=2908210 RepID=UPI001F40D484|nr:NAD(P)/FAD-dependent oxidoreductase [Antarcticibacterium sp. 1MA-6-2]UJH91611.1 NAD(P)/FAD-dependent oxidoreductase [Antarcticibacterium sp. 1MA-6-2]
MKKPRIAIVGGGLAGLTAAIHLASAGYLPVVFEKNTFPHHKVCGEYLSLEIFPYLNSLEIDLNSLNPVLIDTLNYSTPSGKLIKTALPLGGVGLSRYALDQFFSIMAKERGVSIIHETVTDISFESNEHIITTESDRFAADIVLGAYGKRSLIDKKLNRKFIEKKTDWLAVKAHYELVDYPEEVVSLHNFKGGYCGLSKTETGAINVCYLATYKSFKNYKNPQVYQEEVLRKNIHLKSFFSQAKPLFEKDITIAQISFDNKSHIEDHILMLGDAAALIHPLCGNGMAMAIHSGKLAAELIVEHLKKEQYNRLKLEKIYLREWKKIFSGRIRTGRVLQKILLNSGLAEASQTAIKLFPGVLPQIIKRTHGTTVI